MSKRNLIFATGEIYHVYNRTVGHEEILTTSISLRKITEIAYFYKYPQKLRLSQFKLLPLERKNEQILSTKLKTPYVEIYAYAFMPNHYHFLLRQLREDGIKIFTANLQNSFAKYFNIKTNRHGTLFQKPFAAKRIESDEVCLHVSRYIHLNPVTAYLIEFPQLETYPYTSFKDYAGEGSELVSTDFLTGLVGSREKYLEFVADQVDHQRTLAEMKYLYLDLQS